MDYPQPLAFEQSNLQICYDEEAVTMLYRGAMWAVLNGVMMGMMWAILRV